MEVQPLSEVLREPLPAARLNLTTSLPFSPLAGMAMTQPHLPRPQGAPEAQGFPGGQHLHSIPTVQASQAPWSGPESWTKGGVPVDPDEVSPHPRQTP